MRVFRPGAPDGRSGWLALPLPFRIKKRSVGVLACFCTTTNDLRKSMASVTMSSMNNSDQRGYVSGTLIGLVVTIMLLVGALGFGGWAYVSRQDYKNNSDQKATKAADARQAQTETKDAAKYAEEAKNPLKTHKAP